MGRRKKREKSDDEQFKDFLDDIGERSFKLERLARAKGQLVCTDETFSYYSVMVDGFSLMYRKASNRPDGRKMYLLNDTVAMMLGFTDYEHMRYLVENIQYWRKWVSPQALKKAVWRYIFKVRIYV